MAVMYILSGSICVQHIIIVFSFCLLVLIHRPSAQWQVYERLRLVDNGYRIEHIYSHSQHHYLENLNYSIQADNFLCQASTSNRGSLNNIAASSQYLQPVRLFLTFPLE
jgi:hypothetical protein